MSTIAAYLVISVILPGPENGASDQGKVVKGKLIPQDVSFYHEAYYGGTAIYLRSGGFFISDWSVEEYEQRINEYYIELAKTLGKSRNTLIMKGLTGN